MGFYFIMRLGDLMNTYPVNIVNEYLRHANLNVNRQAFYTEETLKQIFKNLVCYNQ